MMHVPCRTVLPSTPTFLCTRSNVSVVEAVARRMYLERGLQAGTGLLCFSAAASAAVVRGAPLRGSANAKYMFIFCGWFIDWRGSENGA